MAVWPELQSGFAGSDFGAVDGGMPVRQAAVAFSVSIAYIYKALIRRRATGDAGPSSGRGRPPRKLSPAQEAALAEYVRAHPGITLVKAQGWLASEHGVTLSMGRCGWQCDVSG
jgi:transposase